MERDHHGVAKMMARGKVGGLERSLGGAQAVWWLFGSETVRLGGGGIQVTPRPCDRAIDSKSQFVREDYEFGRQGPMRGQRQLCKGRGP